MSPEIERLTAELVECKRENAAMRSKLLGIYDNFSDPPVPQEHIDRMLRTIEQMFPDIFRDDALAAKEE